MIEKIGITLTDVLLELAAECRLRHAIELESIVKMDLLSESSESKMQSLSDSDDVARHTVERIGTG